MISCKEYVGIVKEQLKEEVATFITKPTLCVVQIGDDAASSTYVKNKKRLCEEIGIEFCHIWQKDYEEMSQETLIYILENLNSSYNINGIIIQLPIPNKYNIEELQKYISPEKDVDGFLPNSCFKPCTPLGIREWLKYNKFDFIGKNVVVIGRSKIVGLPLTEMLIEDGATVTCCNSKTKSLSRYVFNADLVISAIGKPKYFNKFDFKGVGIIVDVGINRDENGKLCGDVNSDGFRTYLPDTYLTPVPGGVGLLTVVTLMSNVVKAYKIQNGVD